MTQVWARRKCEYQAFVTSSASGSVEPSDKQFRKEVKLRTRLLFQIPFGECNSDFSVIRDLEGSKIEDQVYLQPLFARLPEGEVEPPR